MTVAANNTSNAIATRRAMTRTGLAWSSGMRSTPTN